jgi:TonB family protein
MRKPSRPVYPALLFVCLLSALTLLHAENGRALQPAPDSAKLNNSAAPSLSAVQDTLADSIPHLIKFEKADYPARAMQAGIEGAVLLDLLISDSGTVDSLAVVKTADSSLGAAAAVAARKFRFSPARFNGKAEPVILQYEYRFSLDEIADTIPAVVNFQGAFLEYGTRKKVPYAALHIMPLDTGMIVSHIPLKRYVRRLCAAEKYQFKDNTIMIGADSLGRFSCRALPASTCSVKVIAAGYNVLSEAIVIKKDQLTQATYYLRPTGFGSENEIVVYGKCEESQISHRELSPTEIRRLPGFSGDAIKVIQAMPGVARSMFGSGELMVRGAGPYDNKFFVDGIEVPFVYHAVSARAITESIYNGQLVSKVDFYPGGFDTRYGGAIGGVVDVIPRDIRMDALHGNMEASLLRNSFVLEVPIEHKAAMCVAYRRSYFELYKSILETFLPRFSLMPYYQDYLVRADYSPSKKHHLFFSMMGADDGMKVVVPDVRGGSKDVDSITDSYQFSSGFKLFTLGSDYRILGNLSNKLRLGIRPMSGNVSAFGFYKYSMKDGMVYSLKNTSDWAISNRLHLLGGVDVSYKTGKGVIKFLDTTAQSYSKTMNAVVGGPFLSLDWKVIDKLVITPGLRADLHYDKGVATPGTIVPEFWDYSFDNSTRYKMTPNVRFKAAYEASPRHVFSAVTGTYSGLPHITDYSAAAALFGDDAAVFEALNPVNGKRDAKIIHGQQNVIAYTWRPSPLFSAELQGYVNDQWDVTRYAEREEYNQGPDNNVWIRDNGKARMKGLELLLRRSESKRFFGWISYTLSQCEEYNPWTRVWSRRDWDITNYLQAIGSYKITPKLDFGLRLRYSDGFWYTPVTGRQFYDEDWSWYRFERGKPKSQRMDPYVNVDLKLEEKIPLKWATIRISMEGINLVNALGFIKNKQGKPIYRMPEDNQFQYNFYGDEKDFETFIPLGSLGVNVDF